MIYGFSFICKLKKHQILTNILEKAETLPSKVSVFCEKKESEKSSRKKMPKILFSCTSLVSTFIELSTNNVISILKSKVYVWYNFNKYAVFKKLHQFWQVETKFDKSESTLTSLIQIWQVRTNFDNLKPILTSLNKFWQAWLRFDKIDQAWV